MDGREVTVAEPKGRSDADWQACLSPEQYEVLRKKGTERAFTGRYWDNHEAGRYLCAGCGEELFRSDEKFDSGSGWPSFTAPVRSGSVAEEADTHPRHAPHGGPLRAVRRPPGTRVPRRAWPGGPALLHQLGLAGLRPEEVLTTRGCGVHPRALVLTYR